MILVRQCNWEHHGHILSSTEEHSKYIGNANQLENVTQSTSVCPMIGMILMWPSDTSCVWYVGKTLWGWKEKNETAW